MNLLGLSTTSLEVLYLNNGQIHKGNFTISFKSIDLSIIGDNLIIAKDDDIITIPYAKLFIHPKLGILFNTKEDYEKFVKAIQ